MKIQKKLPKDFVFAMVWSYQFKIKLPAILKQICLQSKILPQILKKLLLFTVKKNLNRVQFQKEETVRKEFLRQAKEGINTHTLPEIREQTSLQEKLQKTPDNSKAAVHKLQKNLKRGKSQKDRESEVEPEAKSMISAQSSKRGLADLSFKTGPCSAVYPKRSNLSEFGSRISHESEQSLNSSVGISLYRNAMESMKERSQSLKKLKKEQEQEDLKLMTFTPRINSSAYGSRLNLLQAPEDPSLIHI
eukprot:TRINITY_DN3414_c0_g1_i1.p1 TRINITY_DN3414_c0_g1~~TRINITY_DN3414_c0_g1_i1.p1  ORF type:complete len:247 (-),score=38.15 TRINITY_DN3414_c0_g1_i1:56-796(-)